MEFIYTVNHLSSGPPKGASRDCTKLKLLIIKLCSISPYIFRIKPMGSYSQWPLDYYYQQEYSGSSLQITLYAYANFTNHLGCEFFKKMVGFEYSILLQPTSEPDYDGILIAGRLLRNSST